MVCKNKRLEACISNVNLCSCLARTTTKPHINITNVCKNIHKIYKPPPIVEKINQETNQAPILLQKLACLHAEGRSLSPFRLLAT